MVEWNYMKIDMGLDIGKVASSCKVRSDFLRDICA